MTDKGEITKLENILGKILDDFANTHGYDLRESITPKRLRFPDGFRYRYYGNFKLARGVKAYCWSVTKNANGKYVSWYYQPQVAKEKWVLAGIREHAKRKDAKARAYKLSIS